MKERSLMQRLSQTRESLKKTLSRILDINRKRKALNFAKEQEAIQQSLEQELKVLNQVATNQAHLVKKYESKLAFNKAV